MQKEEDLGTKPLRYKRASRYSLRAAVRAAVKHCQVKKTPIPLETVTLSPMAPRKKAGERFQKKLILLKEGEDLVDDVREYPPTRDRFVLCDINNLVLGRFKLLEDALQAGRKTGKKISVYAIKSGILMGRTK